MQNAMYQPIAHHAREGSGGFRTGRKASRTVRRATGEGPKGASGPQTGRGGLQAGDDTGDLVTEADGVAL